MRILGIQFAPLLIPLHRRLEALSAFLVTFITTYLAVYSLAACIYFLIRPIFWPIFFPYLLWIIKDRKTSETGGRPSKWFRSLPIFKYAIRYYPISIKMNLELDSRKNYLFCYFPHGIITTGPLLGFLPTTFDGKVWFPKHKLFGITLHGSFYIPFYREFILAFGFCSATAKSINSLLGNPNGGNVVGLIVGGAAEAFSDDAKNYEIVLNNRKGFIKLALKNGSPLVPCISFGETRVFKQYSFPEGSFIKRTQKWIQKKVGAAPIFLYGRGFFQYTFGWLAYRTPINIVVGDPIHVQKKENPTADDINALHAKFMKALSDIFERHKYEYEKNPDECCLIIN